MTQAEQTIEIVPVQKNSVALNFALKIEKLFRDAAGSDISWTPLQRRLAQNLYIGIDAQLKALELKNDGSKTPITWDNVNMTKLTMDAKERIALGLDATIKNHISVVPHLNGRSKLYDLDLRIGYEGKFYCRQKFAVDPPKEVVIELVYSNDKFKQIKKDFNNKVEHYIFDTAENAFARGDVVGGFGYIAYEDETKNKLIVLSNEDFEKAKALAQTKTFWNAHPEKMKHKTVVLRVMDHLKLDPEKINAWNAIEASSAMDSIDADFSEEVDALALTAFTMDAEPESVEAEADEERIGKAPVENVGGDPGF